MPNSFQDIIPPEKRTIRNVSKGRAHARRPVEHPSRFSRPSPPRRRFALLQYPPRRAWVVAIALFTLLFFIFSYVFSGTRVTVVPKQVATSVDAVFEAREGVAEPGALSYETMRIERDGSRTVRATGEEHAELYASGTIVIFNNYDKANQRLIKNTRFETPDGLTFRIRDSVVVPGMTEQNGKLVPGSVEAVVSADEPGEAHNIGLTDFTIPGFEGSPRFEGFFARSKTPMTGGFIGTRRVVEASALETARQEIQSELKQQLFAEAFAQKPDGFYLFEDALFISYESLPSADAGGDEVDIRERAVLHGVLFNEHTFARHIAEQTVGGFDDNPVVLRDIDSLSFSIVDTEPRPWEDGVIAFSLRGEARIVWTFDKNQLRRDLLGRSKDALQTILSGYPSIERAEVVVRPFWKGNFPEKESDITIEKIIE